MSGRTGFSTDLSQTYSMALAHYIVFTKQKMSSVAFENIFAAIPLKIHACNNVCLSGVCQTYSGPEEVVTACYRRCLSYPLYRHWKLTARVFRDVRHIFTAGQLTLKIGCSELPRIDCVF